jgi:hypothetical protein
MEELYEKQWLICKKKYIFVTPGEEYQISNLTYIKEENLYLVTIQYDDLLTFNFSTKKSDNLNHPILSDYFETLIQQRKRKIKTIRNSQ